MLSFTEAADRLVQDGIAQSMTAEGLRKLARDPASGWPIGPDDYRVVGKTRMLPYELLVPYMQARRRGRGPDKTRQRNAPPKQQGEPAVTKEQAEKPDYLTDEQWAGLAMSVLHGVGEGCQKAGLGLDPDLIMDLGTAAMQGLRNRLDERMAEASAE